MPKPSKVRQEAGGIVLVDGRVVLHRTELGNLNFPKGKIEKGETAEQAALREVHEETGLVAEIVAPLGTLSLRFIAKPQEIRFFLMRASESGAEWQRHLETDALLVEPAEVVERLTFKEYRRFWREVEGRMVELSR